jgi:serine/threonine protein kinase
MPAPGNTAELLDLIKRSGVADEAKLNDYIKRLTDRAAMPADPAKLAGLLVRDAILTYFQAEQLLQGKYKRFTIGKYKVLEKLGAGGMGQVFLCEHKLMRRRVAVKVLPTAKAEDKASLERFYREARAVAAVDHPNIVRAYDIDQDENLHFLVMEYVDGTNLQDLVKKVGPLDPIRACHYIYGAAVGLQHAHEMGLVHRDIKPGNILVDRTGVVKVLDMGLARFFNDEEDILTKKYDENVLGTADYLAPEQALDSHTVDIRADIYSLGATFYFLLCGNPPFPEGSVAQKLIWHQNRQPRHIRSLRPDIPDEIVATLDRMMMKVPAKRFQTPADVMASLSRWVATPIPPPSEREMPNISPAAGGSRAPATMVGAYRASGPGEAPTVIAPEPPPIATPPPVNPLDVNTPSPVVWETLDAETQSLSRGDTDRPAHEREARPQRAPRPLRNPPPQPETKRTWIRIAAGAGLLVLAIAIYLIFFDRPLAPLEPSGPASTSHRILVSRAGGENAVTSLRDALSKAGPGDTIAIVETKVTEPKLTLDRLKHKDLTIESATPDGRPAVIEASGTFGIMVDASEVEGLKLRNLELDGKGLVETGVQISGRAAGTAIDGVTVRGVKTSGFKLSNAAGEPTRPIVLDHCRALLTNEAQTGVWIYAVNADTRQAIVQRLRVEGDGTGFGVRIVGPCADVEIKDGRFFRLKTAFSFEQPPSKRAVKGRVTANTIYDAANGLMFQLSPPTPPPAPKDPAPGRFELIVERNYFAKTQAIAEKSAGTLAGVTAIDNAHGPESAQGTFALDVWTLNAPILTGLDPSNDATFLRFPGGQPTIPTKNVKVGAP